MSEDYLNYLETHKCDFSKGTYSCPLCEDEFKKKRDDAIAWGVFYLHGILPEGVNDEDK